MLMKYIDTVLCPICKASRLWKLDADFTDERIATGTVTCQNDHNWYVQEEVFRLDRENSDEEMIFLDHPITGFPPQIDEKVRGDFMIAFSRYVREYVESSEEPLIIIGSPVLFMKYLPETNRDLIIINSSEGILRQVQEIASSKRLYKQVSVIRAENVEFLLANAQRIYIFDGVPETLDKNETGLLLHRDASADVLWEKDNYIFMKK